MQRVVHQAERTFEIRKVCSPTTLNDRVPRDQASDGVDHPDFLFRVAKSTFDCDSTAAVAPNSPPQSSIRRRLRRPAHPQRKPSHRQIAIDGKLSPGPRGFLPGRLSDAGPQRAQIGHHRPASETLHHSSHSSPPTGAGSG